jgi:hypothetical protein
MFQIDQLSIKSVAKFILYANLTLYPIPNLMKIKYILSLTFVNRICNGLYHVNTYITPLTFVNRICNVLYHVNKHITSLTFFIESVVGFIK